MDTPAPRVMKPMMLSPGTGVQQRENLMRQLSSPSTRMPCTAWRARLLRRSAASLMRSMAFFWLAFWLRRISSRMRLTVRVAVTPP